MENKNWKANQNMKRLRACVRACVRARVRACVCAAGVIVVVCGLASRGGASRREGKQETSAGLSIHSTGRFSEGRRVSKRVVSVPGGGRARKNRR